MEEFYIYLQLGFKHIIDLQGYDHMLFIIVLCVNYSFKVWYQLIKLISFFTIGHSITLALATLNIVVISSKLIELLIPITILITALNNLSNFKTMETKNRNSRFIIVLFFGMIHGLGFSNYLKALLGGNISIIKPLLAFNIGLELGQILIVSLFVLIIHFIVSTLKINTPKITKIVSVMVAFVSIYLIYTKLFF